MSSAFRAPVCAAILAAGLLCLAGCRPQLEPEEAAANRELVPVRTVAAVETEISRTTQQPATVRAFFETQVRARASGFVTAVAVDIGDAVTAGQTLATLDVPELEKQLATKQAHIELLAAQESAAEAGIELAQAAVQSATARLEQARSEESRAEASLAAAESEFQRTEDLVNRGSLQNRLLDEALKRRDTETAGRAAVLSASTAAEADVAVAEAELAEARARLLTAQSQTRVAERELEELQVSMAFAEVKAPFDGLITERHVELGDLIEGRSDGRSATLFVVSQVDRLRVQVRVPETDAPFVNPGDTLKLTFPSFASEPPLVAKVTRRSSSLDPSTRTMLVEGEIENQDGKLLPGMFGQATIELESKVAATMLPSRAVRFDESGAAYVYRLDQENRVETTQVTAGHDTGTEIEILSGLQPGQRVIGPHLLRFTEGQQVRPL